MIKIVQRQDIEDVITGNIDAIKSVVYYTHLMAPEDGIHPVIQREGDVLRCKLFSNQISELITGNLICQIETAEHDEEYPDREYNETKKINLNIWIKGKDPRDETLRVGYENLTIGLKHAVDKANTSVQPDDLTHYVKIEDFETQISEKVDRNDVYVKSEIDTQINTLRGEIPSIEGYATETWVESKGYLTEHQQLKTINGETITGSGDIKVSGVGVKLANGAEVFNRYNIEGIGGNGYIGDLDHGIFSHAEGYVTQSQGNASHAEGVASQAKGIASHAEGQNGQAIGKSSHVEGFETIANSDYSHAEGYYTKANGEYSHAEGYYTKANGESSHAEGRAGQAIGNFSHAEGMGTKANAEGSHAEGMGTIANAEGSHAEGKYNMCYSNTIHEVGIGLYNNVIVRKNAHTITKEGLHYIPGVGGYTGVENLEDVEDLATVLSSKLSLNDVYSKDEIDTKINTLRGEIPQITGLATETWVEEKISTKVDRYDVYVKDEIDTQMNTLRGEIPSTAGFATETWVENKGYLTEHQSLAGLATQEYVDNQIGNLDTILDRILA